MTIKITVDAVAQAAQTEAWKRMEERYKAFSGVIGAALARLPTPVAEYEFEKHSKPASFADGYTAPELRAAMAHFDSGIPSTPPAYMEIAPGVCRGKAEATADGVLFTLSTGSVPKVEVTREEMAALQNGEAWRAGDHVEVAIRSAARPGYRPGLERSRAVLVDPMKVWRTSRGMFVTRWRVRWVGADGILGDEATFDERDLTWVTAVPTREPPYRNPARKRYGVGQ